jgi:hypothetical protein
MRMKKLIVVGVAALCVGAVAFAAAPARRPAIAVSRALALRSHYDPFLLKRQPVVSQPVVSQPVVSQPVVSQARATLQQRIVLAAAVRPPYRPEVRSAYQPPTRGPYVASAQ